MSAYLSLVKKPFPALPRGAPAGTVWFGGPLPWFSIAIEIAADDLVPEDITRLFGAEPTLATQKGKSWDTLAGPRLAKFGRWSLALKRDETDEWDVAEAAMMLLDRVTADAGVWKALSSYARIRLSVGISLETKNQGFSMEPALLRRLADCQMQLDFDVYAGDF